MIQLVFFQSELLQNQITCNTSWKGEHSSPVRRQGFFQKRLGRGRVQTQPPASLEGLWILFPLPPSC